MQVISVIIMSDNVSKTFITHARVFEKFEKDSDLCQIMISDRI